MMRRSTTPPEKSGGVSFFFTDPLRFRESVCYNTDSG